MEIGQTGIITFSQSAIQPLVSGSSVLRADGIVDTSADFNIWKHGKKYDNLIFQKVFWKEMMKQFDGPKILDLCDPDWILGDGNIVEIASLADAITCSSVSLTNLLRNYFPEKIVVHIPDRLNFKLFPEPRKTSSEIATKTVWFGFINNAYETLPPLFDILRKHHLSLTIIANSEYVHPVEGVHTKFIKYSADTAFEFIKNADILLNPKSKRAYYKYKSNNKTVIGWKLGLPVAETAEDLERLLLPAERIKEMTGKQEIVESQYRVEQSATQYREIITAIRNRL